MLSMYVTNAKFLRTRLAAMLTVAWLVALVVFASCGGDQASPPAATQVPDDPRAAAGQPPAPEPPVILPATLAKADAPDLEPDLSAGARTHPASLTCCAVGADGNTGSHSDAGA